MLAAAAGLFSCFLAGLAGVGLGLAAGVGALAFSALGFSALSSLSDSLDGVCYHIAQVQSASLFLPRHHHRICK